MLSVCAALAFHLPWLGATLLVLAAFGTEMIDGAGNLLFLRAVHAYERSEMTTVFVSYRDVAQLGPPVVCSVLLSLFSLPSVFVAGGVHDAGLRGPVPPHPAPPLTHRHGWTEARSGIRPETRQRAAPSGGVQGRSPWPCFVPAILPIAACAKVARWGWAP